MNKYLIIPVSFLLLVGCNKAQQTVDETVPVKVKAEKMVWSGTADESFYSGTVEEENISALSFPVMGTVTHIYTGVGSNVKKGQLLAELDDSSMRSAYNAAKAMLDQATDAWNRMKELYDKGSLADVKWIEVQSKLQQARSAEEMARKNLSDCKLYAPYTGVVSSKLAEVGQNVVPGTPVFKLTTNHNLNVNISVPETEISGITMGQEALVVIPALNNLELKGTVAEKGIQANPLSRSYVVKIKIPSSLQSQGIMPGMITETHLIRTSQDSIVVIPVSILQIDEYNNCFVWVNDGGKAIKRVVTCGQFTAAGVQVLSGLRAGEEVIVEGQQKVCEGSLLAL